MKKQINQVKEFQLAFGQGVEESNCIIEPTRAVLRQNILQEEVNELWDASIQGDIVEVADAIVDCMYILLGTAHEFGIADRLAACFDEVHRSNMSKLDVNGKPVYRADGKVIKGEFYSKPDLASIILP
jgi:predicted HAD superfamily Cof-like phosphohydrolase